MRNTWNKLLRSNFLNTLPLSSTKLLLIMMVSSALLLALIATLSVVAWDFKYQPAITIVVHNDHILAMFNDLEKHKHGVEKDVGNR